MRQNNTCFSTMYCNILFLECNPISPEFLSERRNLFASRGEKKHIRAGGVFCRVAGCPVSSAAVLSLSAGGAAGLRGGADGGLPPEEAGSTVCVLRHRRQYGLLLSCHAGADSLRLCSAGAAKGGGGAARSGGYGKIRHRPAAKLAAGAGVPHAPERAASAQRERDLLLLQWNISAGQGHPVYSRAGGKHSEPHSRRRAEFGNGGDLLLPDLRPAAEDQKLAEKTSARGKAQARRGRPEAYEKCRGRVADGAAQADGRDVHHSDPGVRGAADRLRPAVGAGGRAGGRAARAGHRHRAGTMGGDLLFAGGGREGNRPAGRLCRGHPVPLHAGAEAGGAASGA